MADFPTSIPTLGPVPGAPTTTALGSSSPTHADQHQELIAEVVALATELGTATSGAQFSTVADALTFHLRGATIQTISTAGTAQTFDLSLGNTKIVTLTSATCVLSAPTNLITGSPQIVNFLEIVFKQDATGSRVVTWWSNIRWPGGAAPTLTTTATTGRDKVWLTTYDGGSTWDADYALALA
jgi:hypothetical protein